jgi:homoserine dehydrogenase
MPAAPFRVGLIGLGQVGSVLARRLHDDAAGNARAAGRPVILAAFAVRDAGRRRPFLPAAPRVEAEALVEDPSIDAVVELVGGLEPAERWVGRALEAGKEVVTANKQLVAVRGPALAARGGALRFEAAVASAIPIVEVVANALAGESILDVAAILNATTNFILDGMAGGRSYREALVAAQAAGLAESEPSQDVEGHDAAAKLAILCMLCFRVRVAAATIARSGITQLQAEAPHAAQARGLAIKLIAAARLAGKGEIQADVRPRLVPVQDPLGALRGASNGIRLEGRNTGHLYFEGLGGGPQAAAGAVLADLLRAARGAPAAAGMLLASLADRPEVRVRPLPDAEPYPALS